MEEMTGSPPFTVALRAKRRLAPGIIEICLSRPAGFAFIPGQFVRVTLDDCVRDYTMVSGPDGKTLDFCIAMVDQGRFSRAILNVRVGSTVQLSGPHGHFIYQGAVNPAVFVATGTGIAPFVAFGRSGVGGNAILLHGVGNSENLIYRDVLQPVLRKYVPCISQPHLDQKLTVDAFSGRVTHYLERCLEAGRYDFYLCGRRAMIRDATAVIDRRFSDSRLFIEPYD